MALFKVKAVPDFTQLRNELTKLSSTPVKIHVDATEFTALSNQAIKTMNATTKLTRAQNELAVAQEKTKQTANQLAAAQQKNAQSANQLATQMEKTATAEEKARKANLDLSREIQKATAEQEKQKTVAAQTALQQEKTATSAANLAVQQEKTATAAAKAAGNIKDVGQEAKNTSAFADLMGDSFGRVVARMAVWQVLGDVISKTVSAFKDAIATMKDVDTEMVNVQKVTDYSKEQMKALETNAYSLASAYGRAADEITTMYTTFARAGYIGDQLDSMTELGTLLSNIGDVSGDTAAKFLLAVDAAWKLNGSEKDLMTVMDGLNEITNENAVDMEALTSGITVAGSVFAEAGESVQTFSALVGAGVAATQRSGSEISRALRTIVMNIRQIRGETEDGELIDGESIANASKALKEYAGINTMVNGQLRLSSDVLKDLADKWSDLDTVAQSAISEALAGKRQANVLSSLMGNWDTVEKMMTDYADGVGSALRENEIYMDSWEAKSKQLSAAWTEFVSHLIETDAIKGALDGVIGLVELLDTDVGRAIVTAGAAAAALVGVATAIGAIKKAASAFSLASLNPWVLGIMAVGTAIGVAAEATKELRMSYEEINAEIDSSTSTLEANRQKIEEINNTPWVEKTSAILAEREALEAENRELEKQIEHYNQLEKKKAKSELKNANRSVQEEYGNNFVVYSGNSYYSMLTEELIAYRKELEETREVSEENLAQFEQTQSEAAALARAIDLLGYSSEDVTDAQRTMYDAFMAMEKAYDGAANSASKCVSELLEEAQQAGKTGQAMYDYAASLVTASNTELSVSQQIAALQALGLQAGYTAQDLARVYAYANGGGTYQADSAEIKKRAQELLNSGKVSSISQAFNQAKKELTQESWGNLTGGYTPGSGGGNSGGGSLSSSGGSSSSSSDSARKNAQAAIKQLQKERDAELDVIQKQIDALQDQAEIEDRQAKIEEYKLEILKKQDAVMNARNERTVRQYNASTGQWEWVADATKVKKAEEDLENAKKELREYERKVELDLAVEELKTRQEAIKAAYQIKIDAWQDYLDGLANAVATEAQYLAQSVANNKAAADAAKKTNETLNTGEEIESPSGKDDTVYSPSNASETDIKTMQAYLGVTPDGKWGTKSVTALKNSRFASFNEMLRYFFSDGGPLDKAVSAVSSGNSKATQQFNGMKTQGYSNQISYASVARVMGYDEGGILQGMGGIKATPQDEIVLPPKLAARMLTPLASQTFRARVSELGYMYGSEATVPKSLAGNTDNRSYTDHSGATYQIGSIALTERQARSTTIYEAAQLAHNLQAFSGE